MITAGTSDMPVAEEARITAEIMGNEVERLFDVGVAGIHRLLAEKVASARVVIVVAGMEGALPSAVGGLASCPWWPCPRAWGTARPSAAWRRCSGCSTRAPPRWPW